MKRVLIWGTGSVIALLGLGLVSCASDRTSPGAEPILTQQQPLTAEPIAKLLPEASIKDGLFGRTVAVDGNTIVVGEQDAAHVFELSGLDLSPPISLVPDTSSYGIRDFGRSVAIDKDTILVGAPDGNLGTSVGRAFVFIRTGSGWQQEDILTVPTLPSGATFGFSVAISGDTGIVGAPMNSSESPNQNGSAHVFVRSNGTWSLQESLQPGSSMPRDRFGYAVAVQDNRIVVGAPTYNSLELLGGKAYVYTRSGGSWNLESDLQPTSGITSMGQWFGASVALEDPTILVGGPRFSSLTNIEPRIWFFEKSGASWTDQGSQEAPSSGNTSQFGRSVALRGDLAIVGTPEDSQVVSRAGAVYVFDRSSQGWSSSDKIVVTGSQSRDRFGFAVAMSGNLMVAGKPGENVLEDSSGAAWLYAFRADNGSPCASAFDCLSGYCVDGVCCDSACGDDNPDDCEACSIASGAQQDGICSLLTGTGCEDDNACTLTGQCTLGVCEATEDVECKPLDACHVAGECDPLTGCSNPPAPDGTSCPGGTCKNGVCTLPDGGVVEYDASDGAAGSGGSGLTDSGTGPTEAGVSGADGGMALETARDFETSSFYSCTATAGTPRGSGYWWLAILGGLGLVRVHSKRQRA